MAEDDGLDAGVSSPSIAHDSAISRKNLLSSSSKRRIAELNAVQERSLSLCRTSLLSRNIGEILVGLLIINSLNRPPPVLRCDIRHPCLVQRCPVSTRC